MNKQDLIEKIVPEERNDHYDEFDSGWDFCRKTVLKNISSLDLNGWVRVEEIREWAEENKWLEHTDKSIAHNQALNDLLKHLSTLAPQEENKN